MIFLSFRSFLSLSFSSSLLRDDFLIPFAVFSFLYKLTPSGSSVLPFPASIRMKRFDLMSSVPLIGYINPSMTDCKAARSTMLTCSKSFTLMSLTILLTIPLAKECSVD